MYSLLFSKKSDKQLSKMDKTVRSILLTGLLKNIDGINNPRLRGSGLTGDKSGEGRYRIGDYRVLCEIDDSKKLVLVLSIGHRSSVYKTK